MEWLAQNVELILLIIVVVLTLLLATFAAWSYAVVWAARRMYAGMQLIVTKINRLIVATDNIHQRVEIVETHLVTKDKNFVPFEKTTPNDDDQN